MTEKRFNFIKDTVAENLKTPISDNGRVLNIGEVLEELNKLNNRNISFEKKIDRLDDEIKELKKSLNEELGGSPF